MLTIKFLSFLMQNNCDPTVVLEFYCHFSELLWVLASKIQQFLTVFTIWLNLAKLLEGPSEFLGGGWCLNPPSLHPRNSEGLPKSCQIHPVVKTVKNCRIQDAKTTKFSEKLQEISAFLTPFCPLRTARSKQPKGIKNKYCCCLSVCQYSNVPPCKCVSVGYVYCLSTTHCSALYSKTRNKCVLARIHKCKYYNSTYLMTYGISYKH